MKFIKNRENLSQEGHPALAALQDSSWEDYSGLTSKGSLGESAELDHWGS